MKEVCRHGHLDVSFDLALLIECSPVRHHNTRWLVDLLALQNELLKLALVLERIFVLPYMINHVFDRKALAFREGVCTEQLEVVFTVLLVQMLMEH